MPKKLFKSVSKTKSPFKKSPSRKLVKNMASMKVSGLAKRMFGK